MKNFAEMYIDFYSKHEASVRVSITGERILPCEVILFSAFVFVQMCNLKGSGVDQAIAKALLEVKDSIIDRFNLGDYINAADIEIKIPTLVNYRGKGDKGFDAMLNFANTPSFPTPTMQMQPRGFGVLGKEVNYYALQSINVLLKYFTVKYSGDPPRLYVFSDASNLCGREYIAGNISIGLSQGQAVMRIINQLFPKQN